MTDDEAVTAARVLGQPFGVRVAFKGDTYYLYRHSTFVGKTTKPQEVLRRMRRLTTINGVRPK